MTNPNIVRVLLVSGRVKAPTLPHSFCMHSPYYRISRLPPRRLNGELPRIMNKILESSGLQCVRSLPRGSLVKKMLGSLVVLVAVIAFCGVSNTLCTSRHLLEVSSKVFDDLQMHEDGLSHNHQRLNADVWSRRSRGVGTHLDVILTSTVMLTTLFLLLRCAAHMYEVYRFSKRPTRRLAAGDPCGSGVSASG